MTGETVDRMSDELCVERIDQMRAHLEKVLASPTFEKSPRMQRLLRYVSEEAFAGRGGSLKEYSLAVSVFDKPDDFDPGTSATVRVEVGRLRRLLAQYAAEHGSSDDIHLVVPKGGYMPMFEAVDRRAAEAANEVLAVAEVAGQVPNEASLLPGGEWRWLSVLSCAFESSHASDGEIDSAFLDRYDRFRTSFSTIVAQHGGTIDASANERLTVFFGWPNAVEDSGGRAMTAALEILESLEASSLGDIRMGIATSRVVSRTFSDAPLIIGQAPALAGKMLALVPPGGVLVSENTRRLSRTAFETIPAGSLDVGKEQKTLLWRLLRSRSTTQFRAYHEAGPASLVGRREEMELLASRWRLAREGEGQSILLEGEAGIGKSRLAEAVLGRLADEGCQISVQCSPHHTNSALYPVIESLRSLLRREGDDGRYEAAIEELLARLGHADPVNTSLLQRLISQSDELEASSQSASEKKDRTFKLLARLLAAQCDLRPSILLVEDIHWADPTTLELLAEIAALCDDTRLYVLMTGRLGCAALLGEQSDSTVLRLSRLPRADCNQLIDHILAGAPLPEEARATIIDKADGIPLFVEELTKLFLTGDVDRPISSIVPESLNDLLASQLGRLGSARTIAQVATVIGRDFSSGMLKAMTSDDGSHVESALDQLLAAGIWVRSRSDVEERFAFRHALLRDAAYASIVESDRRELHYRVGNTLVEFFPEIAAENPEVIASHMRDAGRLEEAIPFWVDAGVKAARRYELVEAISDFRDALHALETLPPSRERSERELEVLLELGLTVRSAHGYFAPELASLYERARALSTELERPEALAASFYGLWTHAAGCGRWAVTDQFARQFEQVTAGIDETGQYEVEVARLLGAGAAFRGDFAHARIYFDRALQAYDFARHGPRFGYDPGAAAAAYLSWVLWHIGEKDEGRKAAERAIQIAEGKGHPATLAMVLSWLIFHAVCERDFERINDYNQRLQALCAERACRYWQPFGNACVEWAAFQVDGHEFHLKRLLGFTRDFSEHYLTSCLHLLALEICISLGQFDEGKKNAERAKLFIARHDERIWEAEALRLTGELLLSDPGAADGEARQFLENALRIARRQETLPLEKRAVAALELAGGMQRRQARIVAAEEPDA
ncbi:ATP-binding protein [Sphingopyxis granuli]|uniref:ATP-binding protein n=1 Tax=Sphingopyxis granuli TaxID=267128 RepID=UPI00301BC50F